MSNRKDTSIETEKLLQEITETKHIDELLQTYEDSVKGTDFKTYIHELMERAEMTISRMIIKASIGKSMAYQIFAGQRIPNRNLVLRMALILRLDLHETQRLLRLAMKGELYPKIRRDAVIIYCIQNKYTLIDANEMLENLGEALLLEDE
jgi:hypothetical protein